MASLKDVARLAAELPAVVEGERRGNRTWLVAGRGFVWERPFSRADIRRFGEEIPPDGEIIGVRVANLVEKEAILAAGPAAFFTIPHFDGYPAFLIRLKAVRLKALRDAIVDAWLACAPDELASAYLEARGGSLD